MVNMNSYYLSEYVGFKKSVSWSLFFFSKKKLDLIKVMRWKRELDPYHLIISSARDWSCFKTLHHLEGWLWLKNINIQSECSDLIMFYYEFLKKQYATKKIRRRGTEKITRWEWSFSTWWCMDEAAEGQEHNCQMNCRRSLHLEVLFYYSSASMRCHMEDQNWAIL